MKTIKIFLFLLLPVFTCAQTLYETSTFVSTNWKYERDTFSKLETHIIFFVPTQNFLSVTFENGDVETYNVSQRFIIEGIKKYICVNKDNVICSFSMTPPNEEGEIFLIKDCGNLKTIYAR